MERNRTGGGHEHGANPNVKPLIRFLLVPDSSAARCLRRIIAARTPCMGVQTGTWPELVEQAGSAYLVPQRSGDWNRAFTHALERVPDAFWSRSLEVAPRETAAEVEAALTLVVGGSRAGDGDGIAAANLDQLPERPRRQMEDIVRLLAVLDGRLPEPLQTMQQLATAKSGNAVRRLQVCHLDGFPVLTCRQAELIEKLNRDAGAEPDAELLAALESLKPDTVCTVPGSSLEFLQQRLFSAPAKKVPRDGSVQWLGVRDYLQAAEVAAGMVQQMLAENPGLSACEIGLLLPDAFEYSLAIGDAFALAGLPLSGLPAERGQKDLGREALFHFLYCRQKPSPAMALAACLSSPLMPWTRGQGAVQAQTVMDGDYRLQPFPSASRSARQMLDLLREGDEAPETLVAAIRQFAGLLDGGGEFGTHVQQAGLTVEQLCAALEGPAIDWSSLRRLSSPANIRVGAATDFNRNGVTVWREGHEPWRPVRFLLVLSFASGHYPVAGRDCAIPAPEDLAAVREVLGLSIATPAEQMHDRRSRFRRQLGAVSDSLTFMIPRRDPMGAPQSPSESLVFMSRLYEGVRDAESLVLEMDAEDARKRMQHLPPAEARHPVAPRKPAVEDLRFDLDLLALRSDEQGNLKPESPSSLETLMVSRLAWLLRRINAEPLGWKPERLDVMLQGALTHHVFEKLFQAGNPVPEPEMVRERAGPLLDAAIRDRAPFLRAAPWQVERRHLASGILKAALAWCKVLTVLDAEVLGNEVWLAGTLHGLPIHSQADILLGLPDGRWLVVDYKKSSAAGRRSRMQKGYDSQASLYRAMLQTGAPGSGSHAAFAEPFRSGGSIGIVYFMTNDQTSLSDAPVVESGAIPGWEVVGNDVSRMAEELIGKRLEEVGEGRLYLNREGDREFFGKRAGIEPYALDSSALIALFTIPGGAREAG